MDQQEFRNRVSQLRDQGNSIRAIAAALGVNRGRVERALKNQSGPMVGSPDAPDKTNRASGKFGLDVFVGQQEQMSLLRQAVEDAFQGHGRVAMLVGEPGIGKTRVGQELSAYATLRGGRVVWGRCQSTLGTPPYWPWTQAIRSLTSSSPEGALRGELGDSASDIAEIMPELRERITHPPLPTTLDPHQARFRLFDSIARFLKSTSRGKPLLVILDDLQWADEASLLLLEFLSQHLEASNLFILGTYRDTDLSPDNPLHHTLGELVRLPWFRTIPLPGLTQDDVRDFINAASGVAAPPEFTRAVLDRTQGNPLFISQIIQLLSREGGLSPGRMEAHGEWDIRIPVEVHEAILRRLKNLSAQCHEVLTVAAVIGREFDLRLLGRLFPERPLEGLLPLLEESLALRIIEEVTGAVGSYSFSHGLIQEVLLGELSLMRQALLHQRIGEAIEGLYGTASGGAIPDLAHHFSRAAPAMGTSKMIHYSLLTGSRPSPGTPTKRRGTNSSGRWMPNRVRTRTKNWPPSGREWPGLSWGRWPAPTSGRS